MSSVASADEASSSAAFFAGLGLGTLAAAVAALPASMRASAAGVSLVTAWVALWGASALVIGPAAGALRLARPLSRLSWAVPYALLLASGPLVVFARVLKVATHHRPLGGATFALVALGLVLGSVAVSARFMAWSEESRTGRWVAGAVAFGSAALVALFGMPLLSPALRGSALDALLALGAFLVAAFIPIGALERVSTRVGPIAWLVVVATGIALLGKNLSGILADKAPVLLGLAGWIRG